jgi:hypothetical protein
MDTYKASRIYPNGKKVLAATSLLTVCLILFNGIGLIGTTVFPAYVFAQTAVSNNQSLSDSVKELEQNYGINPNPNSSVLERLSLIEMRAMGSVQSGSFAERIEHLKQGLRLPEGPKLPPQLQGSAQISNDSLPQLNVWPPHFVRMEPVLSGHTVGPDYYSEIMRGSNGKIFRFKTMPIPVYITPYNDPRFTEACLKGFEAWEDRSDGIVRFVQVDNPDQARIKVIWSHLGIANDGSNCALGAHTITKWQSKGPGTMMVLPLGAVPVPLYIPKLGPKYTVPPQVIEVNLDLVNTKLMDIRFIVLQNIVTHELGHALGLLGHSPETADMMYGITDEFSRLSKRDIHTLQMLYQQKVDVPL